MKKNYIILFLFIFSCLAIPAISTYHSQLNAANAENLSCLNLKVSPGQSIGKTHLCTQDNISVVKIGFSQLELVPFWTSITKTTQTPLLQTHIFYQFEHKATRLSSYKTELFIKTDQNLGPNNSRNETCVTIIDFDTSQYSKYQRDYCKKSIASCSVGGGDWCNHESNSKRLI